MNPRATTWATAAVLLTSIQSGALGREAKEYDSDVIYDEARIPHYDLPDPLLTAEGELVTTAEAWTAKRRPQILGLFSHMLYGSIPAPTSPLETTFTLNALDEEFLQGKATRKHVLIRFSNERGTARMSAMVFVPNDAPKPVPSFMIISFDKNESPRLAANQDRPGMLNNGWPLGEILANGFGLISVYHADLVGHNEVEFRRGIHPLFFGRGQSFPKAHEWGVISACGWGAMRALDYLETDLDIDHKRIALLGHSKLGKATLWAAAQDERFAMAISANSGCGGAALWRRRSGETLEKISRFPHWLCVNSRKFINREDDLPVDQHMLLALMAPRPVYVASATEDTWADPRGEYLSAYHATQVYELFGKRGLSSSETPPADQAIIESHIGFHLKTGGHSIDPYDWQMFLRFAKHHFYDNK